MDRDARIIAESPVGMAVFEGSDQVLVVANERWRELYDYTGPCGVACRSGELFGSELAEAIDELDETNPCTHFLGTSRVDGSDARPSTTVTLKAMFDEGRISSVIAIAIGSTDELAGLLLDHASNTEEELLERERIARAEAEHANRTRDQFFALISHELRAPITTLLLWERLLRESTSPEASARALDAIHQSATVQARLVSDLLDFSKAINGRLRVVLQSVALGPLIAGALRAARPVARTKQIVIEERITPTVGYVLGDSARLQQIIDNLLSNAIHASPMGSRVTVLADRIGDVVTVHVVDTGRGISPAFLPHVFDAFRQGDEEMSDGLGLGLAVAHQLTTLQHGTLTAHSDGAGTGARFTIELPALPAPPIAATVANSTAEDRGARPLEDVRVLLVDDDRRLIDALQLLLERAGARVMTARSARDGWTQLERALPDVLISDIAMPEEDGHSFMMRIRQTSGQLGRVPSIALTAHATTSDRDRAIQAGFDLYLPKPVDVDKLLGGIASLASGMPRTT